MSSFSIDIFDNDNLNNSLVESTTINSSINPSFNHNIGESTNKLNFRPEVHLYLPLIYYQLQVMMKGLNKIN